MTLLLDKLLEKIKVHSPRVANRPEIYIAHSQYLRLNPSVLVRYGFPFPEDVNRFKIEVVYRRTHPGKVHYWNYIENSPGNVKSDSDVRDITKEQVNCIAKILKKEILEREGHREREE
jgi:hypothetical protein